MLDKLKDEQQILDKLDPAILIGERFGLWPQDQEMVNVRTLADYFTQLTHLPMLLGRGGSARLLRQGRAARASLPTRLATVRRSSSTRSSSTTKP